MAELPKVPALVVWSSASAQEGPPGADPDPPLAYFVGAWEGRLTFKLPGGEEGEGRVDCETTSILDGAFLQQGYTARSACSG